MAILGENVGYEYANADEPFELGEVEMDPDESESAVPVW